ncbi:hypothetical protein [Prauserella flavalba]|uniref:hypothetical protein n=1 Tax=Prauserella flavalba TaxID=1477506 RepID=UPI0036E1FB98
MKILVGADVPAYNPTAGKNEIGSVRPLGGTVVQRLFSDDTPDGLNFRMLRSHFNGDEGAYDTPRHRHAFQQIRWAQSGNLNYAPGQDIPEGGIAYFPKATWYGPQHKAAGISVAIQLGFHGEQQSGPAWDEVRPRALEALKRSGTIRDGVYVQVDPDTGEETRTDSVQALFEKQYELRFGTPWKTPDEGYEAPILMHPDAFAYFQIAEGVECKRLGNFFDHPGPNADVRLSMLRLSSGASYTLPVERAQLFWSTRVGLRIDTTDYPELTFGYSPRGEDGAIGAAPDGVEVVLVELPRLD